MGRLESLPSVSASFHAQTLCHATLDNEKELETRKRWPATRCFSKRRRMSIDEEEEVAAPRSLLVRLPANVTQRQRAILSCRNFGQEPNIVVAVNHGHHRAHSIRLQNDISSLVLAALWWVSLPFYDGK